ncbi:hypothetical protein [Isobaculum melis]|uniref:Uncharacterized protein n=1 Tax=Isobaculum melis TaxID=142588 RepID=A0A1H9TDN7_9LACT|nr:hypothetical protein [Isobaculum melis]SER95271.1 hypothetical protein SAMN04488559_11271 [Isobaculum melis]
MTDEEWLRLRKKEKYLKLLISVVLIVVMAAMLHDMSYIPKFFIVIIIISVFVSIWEGYTLLRKKKK